MRRVWVGLVVMIVGVIATLGVGVAQTAPSSTPTSAPTATLEALPPEPASIPQPSATPAAVAIPEGTDWTYVGSVLSPIVGTWEDFLWGGSPGTVVKVNGTYYLYYVGADGYDEDLGTPTNRTIGVATSADGVTFTKHSGNPIITYSTATAYRKESATNPVVLYENGTWHMWYGAGRAISASEVAIDIRYRTSVDGLTWTADDLVYRSQGDQYTPINAFKEGSSYYLYVLGPLSGGNGALRLLSGADPAALGNLTLVANGPFKGSSGLTDLDNDTLVLHISSSTNGNVLTYTIERAMPTALSSQLRDYTFSGYARHAVLRDGDRWLMYQLDISEEGDGNVVLRMTGLSPALTPEALPTSMPTLTTVPTSMPAPTAIPQPSPTALPTSTPTPAPTATAQPSPTPAAAEIPESADWTLIGSVLSPSAGRWDAILWGGSPGTVIKVSGTYYMYYVGSDRYDDANGTVTNRALGVATSADGRNFTKHGSNPVVTYSTGGSDEEGATNPVVLYDNGTWHMWYAASRYTSPNQVDVDIRYRTSTDGFNWTNDTLVYSVSGHEYIPINAFKSGSTYYLYYLGDLTAGAGPLRVMSGTDPASLSGTTQLAAGPYRGASGLDELNGDTLVIHLTGSTFGTVLAHTIDKSTPTTLGPQLRDYTFSGYARHAVLRDGDRWLMYQLDISGAEDGNVVLRTTD